jgi:hypothetical protein
MAPELYGFDGIKATQMDEKEEKCCQRHLNLVGLAVCWNSIH